MRINFYYKKKKFGVDAVRTGFFRKGLGLMFRSRKTENLLFNFSKSGNFPLTGFFVFFPFLILWLDNRKRVIDFYFARPFEPIIRAKKSFSSIIELPLNKKNRKMELFFRRRLGKV